MNGPVRALVVAVLATAVVVVLVARGSGSSATSAAVTPASARPLPRLVDLGAGKCRHPGVRGALVLGLVFGAALGPCTFAFMAPLLGLAFTAGHHGAAGSAVLAGGLYFLYTAP